MEIFVQKEGEENVDEGCTWYTSMAEIHDWAASLLEGVSCCKEREGN
jgi:hypothetical protein